MTQKPKLKGIIFDFNGTLFFDSHLHEKAWLATALRLTGREVSREDYYRHMHGRTNQAILAYLLGDGVSSEECSRIAEQKEAEYRALCLEEMGGHLQLAPGAVELLDFLTEHQLPCAIATSSEKSNVDFYRREFPLSRWFPPECIVYADRHSIKSKPDPELYLRAAARLGIAPKELAMAEDSFSGAKAITNAGAGFRIGVSPAGPGSFEGMEYVDCCISSFHEVDRSLFSSERK